MKDNRDNLMTVKVKRIESEAIAAIAKEEGVTMSDVLRGRLYDRVAKMQAEKPCTAIMAMKKIIKGVK